MGSRRRPPTPSCRWEGLARETDRIRLGILVSPITFRHPAVIAKSAATLDEMSDGRLDLGIGTGWQEHEHSAFGLGFPPTGERFDRAGGGARLCEGRLRRRVVSRRALQLLG